VEHFRPVRRRALLLQRWGRPFGSLPRIFWRVCQSNAVRNSTAPAQIVPAIGTIPSPNRFTPATVFASISRPPSFDRWLLYDFRVALDQPTPRGYSPWVMHSCCEAAGTKVTSLVRRWTARDDHGGRSLVRWFIEKVHAVPFVIWYVLSGLDRRVGRAFGVRAFLIPCRRWVNFCVVDRNARLRHIFEKAPMGRSNNLELVVP
jgi:hypothetical protein